MEVIKAIEAWWSGQSWLELIGFATGLLCVLLAALNIIWNWPFAIISTGIYIFIFATHRLYADMGQYVYLFISNIYGWYYWSMRPKDEKSIPVKLISRKQIWWSALAVAVLSPTLGFLLTKLAPVLHYAPAAFPYLDSFCTVCSLIAQLLLARKILENWLIWIFVDLIYIGVYAMKDLRLTAVLFAVYTGLAIFGYLDWRKTYRKQQQPGV
ncbi:nicotinamide riboside transporter PnuC [Mucilaginibacter paludis]|uniref:Nicotinamide riboside transporter PnuC n=1 Tax=Mucilaginibacter paludis DSM 18603 TaxID=714943 RepID=H1YG40_9SPHI|nr:nicotinamide riboside transporter PnuC [Mucilaginibacter paludis]EHQ26328.1 nicotinamide mononucleotide transporter PnuC [Mucilaginibacter paludis DSM 18603]